MGISTGPGLSKTKWTFLRKLGIELQYDSSIFFLGIYPKTQKISIQKKTFASLVHCSTTHNSPNLENAQGLKNRWLDDKLWYIYTMEYYEAIRKDEIMQFCCFMDRSGEYYAVSSSKWETHIELSPPYVVNIVRKQQIPNTAESANCPGRRGAKREWSRGHWVSVVWLHSGAGGVRTYYAWNPTIINIFIVL